MEGPFKLLVYAITVIALLALFFVYIAPFFMTYRDPVDVINNNLEVAQSTATLGKGVSEQILFDQMSFSGATFDTGNRSVAFECNDAALCCSLGEKDEKCKQAIEWDERNVEIRERREFETTARCAFEHTLFVCKVYLGKKPAQVAIPHAEIKEKVNLGEEKAELDLTIENTGSVPIFSGSIKLEVYEVYLEGSQWNRRYIGNALVEDQFQEIAPGESLHRKIQINVPYGGKYDVELTVNGENAGFETKKFSFEATGGSTCRADRCEAPVMEFGKCEAKCHCLNCLLSSDCEEKIRDMIRQVPFGNGVKAVDISNKEITPLGSNLVEVLLPDEYCAIDLIVDEAKAYESIINFSVKNVFPNEVKKNFSVELYLDYGSVNKKKIALVSVYNEEMLNEPFLTQKNVSVDLLAGKHTVTIVVNPDREVPELNYKNNTRELTVEIPELPHEPAPYGGAEVFLIPPKEINPSDKLFFDEKNPKVVYNKTVNEIISNADVKNFSGELDSFDVKFYVSKIKQEIDQKVCYTIGKFDDLGLGYFPEAITQYKQDPDDLSTCDYYLRGCGSSSSFLLPVNSLRTFVFNGGTLFVTDWELYNLLIDFPDVLRTKELYSGTAGKYALYIKDAELAESIGNDIVEINFDMGFWKTLTLESSKAGNASPISILAELEDGTPIMFKFNYGKGTVYFSAYHLHAQQEGLARNLFNSILKLVLGENLILSEPLKEEVKSQKTTGLERELVPIGINMGEELEPGKYFVTIQVNPSGDRRYNRDSTSATIEVK